MKRTGAFVFDTLRASLPLWLWAVHFALCYAGVAVGCRLGWNETVFAGASLLRWTLALASLLALALAAWLLWRAAPRRPAQRHTTASGNGLAARVRRLSACLALVGIAWTTLPVLALPAPCVVT
jgi:hypothetical protein